MEPADNISEVERIQTYSDMAANSNRTTSTRTGFLDPTSYAGSLSDADSIEIDEVEAAAGLPVQTQTPEQDPTSRAVQLILLDRYMFRESKNKVGRSTLAWSCYESR